MRIAHLPMLKRQDLSFENDAFVDIDGAANGLTGSVGSFCYNTHA